MLEKQIQKNALLLYKYITDHNQNVQAVYRWLSVIGSKKCWWEYLEVSSPRPLGEGLSSTPDYVNHGF